MSGDAIFSHRSTFFSDDCSQPPRKAALFSSRISREVLTYSNSGILVGMNCVRFRCRAVRMSQDSLPQIPDSACSGGPGCVPVYNCHIILSRIPATGRLTARVANLADLSAEGNAERELLLFLTRRFKAVVQDCVRNQREIPWIDPPELPAPGEQQRYVPVHL